jgi:hypothetical protein
MNSVVSKVQSLCTPALIFFIISVLSLFLMIFDNVENTTAYCLGNIKCNVPNTAMVFIVEIVILIVWTWLLNLICSRGHPNIAWFILLFPYILLFTVVLFGASDIRYSTKINESSTPIIDTFAFR